MIKQIKNIFLFKGHAMDEYVKISIIKLFAKGTEAGEEGGDD